MKLLLLRHGIAEDIGPQGTDASRRLTEEGIEKTRKITCALAAFSPRPDVILSSPLRRAVQTAEFAGEAFGLTPRVVPELAAGADEVLAMVSERDESVVMLVGHEPTFSEIVETLCTSGEIGGFVKMKKAGCACLEVDLPRHTIGHAQLLWLTTPKMFA